MHMTYPHAVGVAPPKIVYFLWKFSYSQLDFMALSLSFLENFFCPTASPYQDYVNQCYF